MIRDSIEKVVGETEGSALQKPLDGRRLMPPKEEVNPLLALLLSQLADMSSTEELVGAGGRELNPMPGMQSTAGRLALTGVEALALDRLNKENPEVGRKILLPLSLLKFFLAASNQGITERMRGGDHSPMSPGKSLLDMFR